MKKIALIMDGWKRFFTYAWPSGILQRIKETNEDINLYIFNSSGDWSLDKDYNVGEYNIYRLPDLKEFDGIILDLNNVRYPEVREYVIKTAKESGKPVISIANEWEDFYYVGINNYKPMQEIMEHLRKEHSCKKFWFLMGPMDNYESRMRACAIIDYLNEHQIAYAEEDFYYESFDHRCGRNGFRVLSEAHNGEMPDAIVCANDNIAVGVCAAATDDGYEVPRDFCLTGFDDFDKASYYLPQITTVSHTREEVGYKCVELLLDIWNGNEVPRFHYTNTECLFSESCGCVPPVSADGRVHARDQILYGIETTDFEEQILYLEYELMQCKTVKEMSDCIPKCIPSMKCDAMYLVLDEHMDDFRERAEVSDRHLMEDGEFCIHGYPKQMKVEFIYEDGTNKTKDGIFVDSLFPMFDYAKSGTDFLFMPLHFKERTVGYFVIRNAVYLMEKQYLFKVLNTFTTAMENLHKKEKLAYMNQVLSELYIKDSMTGLYNRLGYQKLACKLFEEKKKQNENLIIMFLDMDRLKYINDHFGHEYGDFAIKVISKAILNHSPKDAIPIRNGGDEFLLILNMMDTKHLVQVTENIRKEIWEKSTQMQFPFGLTVSIGYVVTDMEEDKTLDDYVREADEVMYAEKVSKKVNRS